MGNYFCLRGSVFRMGNGKRNRKKEGFKKMKILGASATGLLSGLVPVAAGRALL